MNIDNIPIVDAHLHLFNLAEGNYHWLKNTNEYQPICRDFGEPDLYLGSPLHLRGFVHIEAGFDNTHPWREIAWLEQHCSLPFRSIAHANILNTNFAQSIQKLTQYASVAGIRHILDHQATAILDQPLAQQHLALLAELNLSFDAQLTLTDPSSLRALTNTLRNHPKLKVSLNHAGWPAFSQHSREWLHWHRAIEKLTLFDNLAIKLSGWEMTEHHWQLTQILPLIEHCLTCFDRQRLMLGSNFPLSLTRHSYHNLWQKYANELIERAPDMLAKNAINWYELN